MGSCDCCLRLSALCARVFLYSSARPGGGRPLPHQVHQPGPHRLHHPVPPAAAGRHSAALHQVGGVAQHEVHVYITSCEATYLRHRVAGRAEQTPQSVPTPRSCPRSVAGCGVLRQVLLASPVLSQLRAAGCSRLMVRREAVIQSCMDACQA